MQIGTKLLNEIQVGRFSNLNRDIQETQGGSPPVRNLASL